MLANAYCTNAYCTVKVWDHIEKLLFVVVVGSSNIIYMCVCVRVCVCIIFLISFKF